MIASPSSCYVGATCQVSGLVSFRSHLSAKLQAWPHMAWPLLTWSLQEAHDQAAPMAAVMLQTRGQAIPSGGFHCARCSQQRVRMRAGSSQRISPADVRGPQHFSTSPSTRAFVLHIPYAGYFLPNDPVQSPFGLQMRGKREGEYQYG